MVVHWVQLSKKSTAHDLKNHLEKHHLHTNKSANYVIFVHVNSQVTQNDCCTATHFTTLNKT